MRHFKLSVCFKILFYKKEIHNEKISKLYAHQDDMHTVNFYYKLDTRVIKIERIYIKIEIKIVLVDFRLC